MAGTLEIKLRPSGVVGIVRRPSFEDLVLYEADKKKGGADNSTDFVAKRALFKRINMGEDLKGAEAVSVAAIALIRAGDELTVLELDDDDLTTESAEAVAAAQAKGQSPIALGVSGLQLVFRTPRGDELQLYYKTSDQSVLRAAKMLADTCRLSGDVEAFEARFPAAYTAISNALAAAGGLTTDAEVLER